jgi:DNA-binding GntR family transcriptional regulator
MLEIHDRIMQAICARDVDKAIRELEIHYDMQIEQLYEQNDDTTAEQQDGGATRLHDNP